MRPVSHFTFLILALVSATNAYDSVYSRDTGDDQYFARAIVNDFRRRSDMISMFSTRHLVEELERRLLPRGNGGGDTPAPVVAGAPPHSGGQSQSIAAQLPLPKDGFANCAEQTSLNAVSMKAKCLAALAQQKLKVDIPDGGAGGGGGGGAVGGKLHIDTNVGAATGEQKAATPGSPSKAQKAAVLPPAPKSPDNKGQKPLVHGGAVAGGAAGVLSPAAPQAEHHENPAAGKRR